MAIPVPIELRSFRGMVTALRVIQKHWFKFHLDKDLCAAKNYERLVDKWLGKAKEQNYFISLVRKMREHQTKWFKEKRPSNLQLSFEYEKRVDKWLANEASGPGLFD